MLLPLRALGRSVICCELRSSDRDLEVVLITLIAVAPFGARYFRWFLPKARKASPWA